MSRAVVFVLVVAALASAGCLPLPERRSPPAPAYGPATERQVEAALDRYSAALAAANADAVASMYAPDGVWIRSSGQLQGHDAIRRAVEASGSRVASNEMTVGSVSWAGNAVVQSGEFRQGIRGAGGKVVMVSGHFEATWNRGPDGEWRIAQMVTRAGK